MSPKKLLSLKKLQNPKAQSQTEAKSCRARKAAEPSKLSRAAKSSRTYEKATTEVAKSRALPVEAGKKVEEPAKATEPIPEKTEISSVEKSSEETAMDCGEISEPLKTETKVEDKKEAVEKKEKMEVAPVEKTVETEMDTSSSTVEVSRIKWKKINWPVINQ
ncbi:hypothetical protein JTB14_031339 [Gonioctena quinquepunctata]|nr:hypothetical protein JTB14_031339 [Gonioctena quinquepunctata]